MSKVNLFPVTRAVELARNNQHEEVGDLAASYLAICSLHEILSDEYEQMEQAFEVAKIRLGLGQTIEPLRATDD